MNWLDYFGWNDLQLTELRSVSYTYVKQGKYDIALKFFEALIILSNEDVYDLQMLGAIHLQLGNHLDALNYIDQALKKDPGHLPTLLNRAKTLFALGYKKQAIAQTKALLITGEREIVQKADALLLSYL